MAKKVASRGSDQFMVRFPDGMRDAIKEAADLNGRSMNSEIIARVENSLHNPLLLDVQIEIDAKGNVLWWDTIHEKLKAVSAAIGSTPISLNVHVINAKLASKSDALAAGLMGDDDDKYHDSHAPLE